MPEQPYEGSVWTDGMNERDQFRLLVHQHTKATRWLRNALNARQGVVSTRIVLNLLTEWPEEFAPTPSAQTEAQMPEQPPERPVADPPERSYREIAAGLSSHFCFAGCTLVTCNFCHEQRCVNDLHLCTPKPAPDARPADDPAPEVTRD